MLSWCGVRWCLGFFYYMLWMENEKTKCRIQDPIGSSYTYIIYSCTHLQIAFVTVILFSKLYIPQDSQISIVSVSAVMV